MKPPPVHELKLSTGRVVAFVDLSRRPVVFLLHGNSSSKEIFRNQIAMLRRRGYGIVVPDLPGHGGSADARRPTYSYSLPGYAGIIREILDHLGISEAHLLGWSLGGHIGLELLATEERVRSLLITGAPPVRPGTNIIEQAFVLSPSMSLAGKRHLDPRELRTYAECLVGGSRHVTQGVLTALRRTDGRARYWLVKNTLAGIGTDEVATVRLDRRLLAVIHGRHDPFVNRKYVESLRYHALWRGSVQTLDAGHAPHWERPRLFNELAAAFFEEAGERK